MLIKKTKTVEIPHEPGCTMTFMPLTGKQTETAENIAVERAMAARSKYPQPVMLESADASLTLTREEDQEIEAAEAEASTDSGEFSPYAYDVDTVLGAVQGFAGPGYDEHLQDGKATKADVAALDATTRKWAFQAILSEAITPS